MPASALGLPPWTVLGVLLGVISAALFHLLFSTRLRQLPLYVAIGTVSAVLGGLLGAQLGPTPWSIGEAHLLAICGAAWSALAIARLLGL
jgi:uncharacterized membrane protein YjjB (DUF3815 family)